MDPYGVEMMKVMTPVPQRRIHHFHPEHRRQRRPTSPTSACSRRSATGRMPSGSLRSSTRTACGGWGWLLRTARASGSSTDRHRASRRTLRAGHARSQIPGCAGRDATGLVRADAGDADVLRDAHRRAGRDSAEERRRRHPGRASDVPVDQGGVSPLLQQRAERSAGAARGPALLPLAARVPAARNRHPARTSAERPAGRRHDADEARALSARSICSCGGRGRRPSTRGWSAIFGLPRT